MSKITGRDTTPEILVRKFLFARGFRFRKNDKRYPGKPDIVLPKFNTIIFVHGCFWHGHSCKASKLPATRKDFWESKIAKNVIRDKKNEMVIKSLNWKVITIWQCQINNGSKRREMLPKLVTEIKK